jgi:hypothetical protein
MNSIFISYRRADASCHAGRLYDHLVDAFGEEHVFFDIDSIPPGQNFVEVITRTLSACDAVLVVIGREWMNVNGPDGKRRIDDPMDPVTLEVSIALESKRLVIPVLVDGATIPDAGVLPGSLVELSRCNAVTLTDRGFRKEMQSLVNGLRKGIPASKREKSDAATWFIEGGVDIRHTRFRYKSFFATGDEFILTGTNFGDQMGDRGTPPGLLHQLVVATLKRSAQTTVFLVVAPYELLEKMVPNSIADLKGRSASRLKMLQHDPRLSPQERSRLHIFDHRGATFLSVALRDPGYPSERRGLAIATSRWFKDEAGLHRMFFAVEEASAQEVFKAFVAPLYPSIKVDETSLSLQPDRSLGGRTIDQICAELGAADDPFSPQLSTHPL